MANLSKDQVRQILSDAPEGTSPEGIISGLRAKGHVLEGFQASAPTGASKASFGNKAKEAKPNLISGALSGASSPKGRKSGGLFTRWGETTKKQGEKFKAIGQRVTTPQDKKAFGVIPQRTGQNPLSTAVQAVGTAIGTAGSLGFDVLEEVTPKPIKQAAGSIAQAGLRGLLGASVTDEKLPAAMEKFSAWAEEHPQAAADIEGLIEIAGILPVGRGAKVGVEAGERVLKEGTEVATKKLAEGSAEMLARREAATLSKIDNLTGSIVQGKTKDIGPAKRALKELDTTGIKTYDELTDAVGGEINTLSKKVDEAFGVNKKPVILDDLTRTVKSKSGKRSVEQNFVDDAMKHLEELYEKTGDAEGLLKVQDLRDKAVSEGLLAKEINDLSREYGKEFGTKAFSKVSGDPLTSVNAVKFENVRKGIKDSARGLLDGDAAKLMDKQISDLFTLQKNTEKMVEKVNQLTQKIKKRGPLEKLGRGLAIGTDALTGGVLRGFMQKILIQSNVGLKSLNALDIQSALKKNLRSLDKLLDSSDDELVDGLLNMIKENAEQAGSTVESVVETALGSAIEGAEETAAEVV